MKARKTARLFKETSILLVCDIQNKFVPRVYGKEGVLEASSMMVRAAQIFGIPIVVTEHTVKVMGETCEQIKKHLREGQDFVVPKTKFSMIIPEVNQILDKFKQRRQVILVGMETQVCILQTCLDLLQKDYEVFLPVDAVTSIRSWQRTIALKRLQKEGATLTTFESTVFDLLKDSKDEKFKDILAIIKQSKRENAISHL